MRPVFLGIPSAGMVRWSFQRHLRRETAGLVGDRADSVLARSSTLSRELVWQRRAEVPDAQGLNIVTFAAVVLAGFRTLVAEGIERPDAYEALRKALMATWATPVRWLLRGFLAASPDPVAVASRPGYLRVMQTPFGRLFSFDHRTASDRADLVVTDCGFHRYFAEHGEPLLTRIMCEWDHTLFDEMNSSKRPIQMSRPATISTGCSECVFRHERSHETELLDIVVDRRPETLALVADLSLVGRVMVRTPMDFTAAPTRGRFEAWALDATDRLVRKQHGDRKAQVIGSLGGTFSRSVQVRVRTCVTTHPA